MANGFTQEALEIMRNASGNGGMDGGPRMVPRSAGTSVEALDEMVFGKYVAPQEERDRNRGQEVLKTTLREVYEGNVTEDTKRRLSERVANTNIPKQILEEMLSNPLISKLDVMENDDVGRFMESVMSKSKPNGSSSTLDAQKQITERIERMDGEKARKVNEGRAQADTTGSRRDGVDYDLIKSIVESAVDERMKTLMRLNESKGGGGSAGVVEGVLMKDENTFWFRDLDNNIFECTLRYKGRNVPRKRNSQ